MGRTRTENSIRNVATSLGGQLLNNALRFICRTVFIYTLGNSYLGISSLYTNILTLLSISELGLSTAITFSLYKPLADGDEATVRSLMAFFKKAYRYVGFAILGIGLALIPFLPKLMTGTNDNINIYLYYILYLTQTVVSYWFFAYKSVLLAADQQKYIIDVVSYVTKISVNIIQILSLVLIRSFLIYTIIAILGDIATNIFVARAVDKRYTFLREPAEALPPDLKKNVFDRTYAMFLYKIGGALGNATDNLIISAFKGVEMVGIYNNYFLIVQIFQRMMSGVFQSFISSIGNLYVTEGKEKSWLSFRGINLLASYLVSMLSVCFLVVFQPFIKVWIGDDYLLDNVTMVIVVANFTTNYLQSAVQIFKDASGVFVEGRYRALVSAVLNLIISIFLTDRIGLPGVFLGSIISRMLTAFWYDSWLLCRRAFDKSPAYYYAQYVLSLLLITVISGVIFILFSYIPVTGILCVLLRGMAGVLFTTAVFYLIYHKSDEYRYIMDHADGIKKKLNGIRKKLTRGK